VPAYRAFLAEHDVDPVAVRTVADFRTLPLPTKDNYLRRHPLTQLCRGGQLGGRRARRRHPVRAGFHDSFGADRRATLAVVCFALGTWVGGMYTAGCCRHLAAKGYPITVITPGSDVEEILRVVTALGPQFDRWCCSGIPRFSRASS
jgi:phenylacetate-CoA ligase